LAANVRAADSDYLPFATKHSLRNILDRLLLVVQTSARKFLAAFGPDVVLRPGYRKALIEASIVTNAALAAYSIQYLHNCPDTLGSVAGRFGVDKSLGFVLPCVHEFPGFPVVGDGGPQDSGLLGRDRTMDKLAVFHVPPHS
jgi:hypothetical protein